jgi:hypothetical protein
MGAFLFKEQQGKKNNSSKMSVQHVHFPGFMCEDYYLELAPPVLPCNRRLFDFWRRVGDKSYQCYLQECTAVVLQVARSTALPLCITAHSTGCTVLYDDQFKIDAIASRIEKIQLLSPALSVYVIPRVLHISNIPPLPSLDFPIPKVVYVSPLSFPFSNPNYPAPSSSEYFTMTVTLREFETYRLAFTATPEQSARLLHRLSGRVSAIFVDLDLLVDVKQSAALLRSTKCQTSFMHGDHASPLRYIGVRV